MAPSYAGLITDDGEAQRERFLGSPTIRVDGVDVDPSAEGRIDYGLTCRLYATAEGPQRLAADDWVRKRLRRQVSERQISGSVDDEHSDAQPAGPSAAGADTRRVAMITLVSVMTARG